MSSSVPPTTPSAPPMTPSVPPIMPSVPPIPSSVPPMPSSVPLTSSSVPTSKRSSEEEQSTQTARIPHFGVQPSSMLKCPVMLRQIKPGSDDRAMMRLAAEEFRAQRVQKLHQSTQRRVAAEEEQCREQRQEANILMYAAEKGLHWSCLPPQLALALARAARDITMAQQKTVKLRIKECEDLLETLKDDADDAFARVNDAARQIGTLLSFFDRDGIRVDLRPQHFGPSFHYVPEDLPFGSSSDVEF